METNKARKGKGGLPPSTSTTTTVQTFLSPEGRSADSKTFDETARQTAAGGDTSDGKLEKRKSGVGIRPKTFRVRVAIVGTVVPSWEI